MCALRSCLSDGSVIVLGSGSITIVTEEPMNHVRKTSNYTASVLDFVEGDTTAVPFTVMLPPLSGCTSGDKISVQLFASDDPANQLTVDGDGSDTINGSLTQSLTYVKEQYNFFPNSDLTDWIMC